jgi:glycosyltransferase involved in cell wall biosynthesis
VKVVLIYRQQQKDAYSIEELFHAISAELDKHIEVLEYEAGSRWNILIDAWKLRKLNADIYHVTGDINYIVPLLPAKKTVLTVHDIGHFLFGLSGIKRWLYKWLWLIIPIRHAGMVTSVSIETRDNIINHLDINGKYIQVIENCYSSIFKPVKKSFATYFPVILQVGTKPYKNVPRLLEAVEGLKCHLVLIGKLDEETKQRLVISKVDYENHVGLTHGEIYKQYVNCDMVSFASIGEGFGVPIIEAQATGRPLLTSNVSPMREVAGNGACLVNPLDVADIRAGILKIINNADYRNQLVELGLLNAARYSPASIGAQYLNLYRRVAL